MVFADLQQFLTYFAGRAARADYHIREHVKHAAEQIERDARGRIGTYQGAVGPFPAWEPLTDATLNGFDFGNGKHIPGKIELGYAPPDNPLLREGELRESIQHTVQGYEMEVGSNSQVAIWQERGTKQMPPRSFLGAAAAAHSDAIAHEIGLAVAEVLGGLRP